jgi:hypothetical protein
MRVLIGFLLAPGVPALVLYLVKVDSSNAPLVPLLLTPLAYVAALVLGIPVYLVLRRRRIRTLLAYVILGALIGVVFYALYFGIESFLSPLSVPKLDAAVRRGAIAAIYSAAASAVFWLIAISRFPHSPERGNS